MQELIGLLESIKKTIKDGVGKIDSRILLSAIYQDLGVAIEKGKEIQAKTKATEFSSPPYAKIWE